MVLLSVAGLFKGIVLVGDNHSPYVIVRRNSDLQPERGGLI